MKPAYASARTQPERDALILAHQGYVRALACMIARTLPDWVEIDDLIQDGQLGLIRAARLFDAARGVAFRTFAYPYIRGAIIDGLRRLFRSMPTLSRQPTPVSDQELASPLDRESFASAADDHDAAVPVQQRLVQRVQRVAVACVLRLAHQIVDHRNHRPDQIAELRELCDRVWRLTAVLPAHQRVLLRLHYVEGRSFADCARLLGRDKSRISRWHRDALERLRTLLSAEGRRAACA